MDNNYKNDPITAPLVEKYDEFVKELNRIDDRISKLQKQRQEVNKDLDAIINTARLFDIDLKPYHGQIPLSARVKTDGNSPTAATIKDYILDRAKQVYPLPVKAALLRSDWERLYNEVIHEKTVGMTLYRLLQKGEMRRVKHDWFFVPEGERNKEKPSHSKYEGLLDD